MARVAVTEAESAILSALWRHGPLSFASLIEAVRAEQAWGDATIKTLLGRLMRKGAVRSDRDEGRQRYHAAIERQTWLDDEIQSLTDRLFSGDREALIRHLSET